MMHILFVTPYYPPEISAPAVRISETATRLVKRGHQVTVLTTFPNFPSGIVPQEYRGRLIQHELCDGVHIVRVWSYVSANKGFLRRILAQLSFGCLAAFLGWKAVGRPDVMIVESPPLFDAIAGRMLAWLKHCPFIFMVADLWPEAAIQMGVLRNQVLIRLSEWLEWSTYQRANLVWVVSEGVRDLLIQRGLSPERIFLLTNGVDTALFHPLPQVKARAELGWDDRFTVLYAGTHGLAQGLATILSAAEQMRDHADIHIVFAGDGAAKADLMAQAESRCLKNVTFLDAQPHDRLPLLLAGADVCLVPLRKVALFETTLPVKMFEVMACSRPMLLSAEGKARQLAEREAGAAIAVEPENPEAMVSAILYLREHPEEAEALGRRGRKYVEARFDREQLTAGLEARIAKMLEKKMPVYIPETLTKVGGASEKSESHSVGYDY
ncbi:MAG: glycosyltransferase family 4 protein [Ktedonobacteraceae bacterium]